MTAIEKPTPEHEAGKEWEEPLNPEAASDSRDKEQAERLYEEATRRKENLTEKDDTDKEKNTNAE